MFTQRARQVAANFTPTATEMADIGRICQLVEGMPLGLELAAPWIRTLSCREIAAEIERSLDFLTTPLRNVPERHRNLRVVFEQTWGRLSDAEQAVLSQLSVFRGGCTREAAEQVTAIPDGSPATLLTLSSLVDKALLRRTNLGRYELHELIRQFGAEKLAEAGTEIEATQDRHGTYFAAFLRDRESQLKAGRQKEALAEINADIGNVRAGWRRAVNQGKVKEIGQSVECLGLFYEIRSWWVEGETTFAAAAARLEEIQGRQISSDSNPRAESIKTALACVLTWRALFTRHLGLYDTSRDFSQRSLTLLRNLRPQVQAKMALPLINLGTIMRAQGDYAAAKQLYQDGLAIAEAADARWDMTIALNGLGIVASREGNHTEAERLFRATLAISEAAGDQWTTIFQLGNLSDSALDKGNYEEAERLVQQSLTLAQEIGHDFGVMLSLSKLGHAACGLGNYTESKRYFREALALALEIQEATSVLRILTGIAALIFASEPTDKRRKRAVEVATIVLHHATTDQETKDRAKRLLARMETQLSPDVVSQARTRGQAKGLETVVTEILGNLI